MARSPQAMPVPEKAPVSARITRPPSSPLIGSTVVLARWRFQRTLGMLFVTGTGMIAAVLIVCAIPLYSQISTTAGLHSIFTATPDSSIIDVHATLAGLSRPVVNEVSQRIEPISQSAIGPYTSGDVQFSIQSQGFNIAAPKQANAANTLTILGYAMNQAAPHIHLLAGRLPQSSGNELQVLLTQQTAQQLRVHVGSLLSINFNAYTARDINDTSQYVIDQNRPLLVSGIYVPSATNDSFWHGTPLDPVLVQRKSPASLYYFHAIASNDGILAAVDSTVHHLSKSQTNGVVFGSLFSELYWYYRLDPSKFSINNIDELSNTLTTMQGRITAQYGNTSTTPDYPYIETASTEGALLNSNQGSETLDFFRNRVNVAQIPITILMVEVVALVLFFVAIMAELLVERQSDSIAVLRSRGASRQQLFGSFVTQSVGLGILAFFVGPLLALLTVPPLVQGILGANGKSALNVIMGNPLSVALFLAAYAALAVVVAILAMSFSTFRAVSFGVLAMRRESGRSTTRPLWQRLNLDILAIIVALTGYAISIYLNNVQSLDAQTRILVQAPLSLIAPTFLLLTGLLLLLRLFPLLLRLGALMAARGQGAPAVLALGQMARAPRQSMRMALLLALTSALAIFSLVFTASQDQHVLDIAAYQVGSDLSGTILSATSQTGFQQQQAAFKRIPGISSVTMGYSDEYQTDSNSDPSSVTVLAVDADTFAQTAVWNDPGVNLSSLMQQLVAQRQQAVGNDAVPAVVDSLTWNRLDLSAGTQFSLQVAASNTRNGVMTFFAIAQVPYIPTLNDSTEPGDNTGSLLSGGFIADYQTFTSIYHYDFQQSIYANHVWLRTTGNANQLPAIRTTLTKTEPRVSSLQDRYALVDSLSSDPLYLDLIGELALGASTALFLALFGSLLASWLNARGRLTNFAILRALGSSPSQIASVLIWEQCITYIVAIALGVGFGTLLCATIIPSLVITSVSVTNGLGSSSTAGFYALQHMLPVRIIIPPSLILVLVALVVMYVVALLMMVRVVRQPALSQVLRINED
jgi:ABC-type lipoprotein release transport system permease subunit